MSERLSIHPVPKYIEESIPYQPGKPIEELERELGISDVLKLASNENPFGPSPKVFESINDNRDAIRLYPDAAHFYLRNRLAEENGVTSEEIIIGNGSNEVIDFLVRTFCVLGDNIVSCAVAFIAYRISAKIHGVEYREAKLREDLVADLDTMIEACDDRTKVVFLPNPNNPTGTYVGEKRLRAFLDVMKERKCLVVLDSAYVEYVTADDYANPIELYKEYPNIVVTRTFSKAYGLAGLRVGYGIAHPDVITAMWKVKMPFNVTNFSLSATLAALDDKEHLERSVATNAAGLVQCQEGYKELGLRTWESQGNFVLVDFEQDPIGIYSGLLKEGLITRPVIGFGLKTHLRITVGTEAENERLLAGVKKVLGK